MDTILGEDWTEMRERYKYYDHAFDKKGQPGTILQFKTNTCEQILILI